MYSILSVSVLVLFLAVTSAVPPKSINIVLETSIRIEPRDNITKVLENVRRFVDKVKYGLMPTIKVKYRRAGSFKRNKYFTNFINETVQAILDFDVVDIEYFFIKLYEEVKYYLTYKGSALAEIISSRIVQTYLEDILQELSEIGGYTLQTRIYEYVQNFSNDKVLHRLGDFLNNYYDQTDEVKMKRFVDKLKNCTEEEDFEKVIRNALYVLVVKHYDKFNYTVRSYISDKINKLAESAIRRYQRDHKSRTKTFIHTVNPEYKKENVITLSKQQNIPRGKKRINNNLRFKKSSFRNPASGNNKVFNKHGQRQRTTVQNKFSTTRKIVVVYIPTSTPRPKHGKRTKNIEKRFKVKHQYDNVDPQHIGTKNIVKKSTQTVIQNTPKVPKVLKTFKLKKDIVGNATTSSFPIVTNAIENKIKKNTIENVIQNTPKALKRLKSPENNIASRGMISSYPQYASYINITPVPYDLTNGNTIQNVILNTPNVLKRFKVEYPKHNILRSNPNSDPHYIGDDITISNVNNETENIFVTNAETEDVDVKKVTKTTSEITVPQNISTATNITLVNVTEINTASNTDVPEIPQNITTVIVTNTAPQENKRRKKKRQRLPILRHPRKPGLRFFEMQEMPKFLTSPTPRVLVKRTRRVLREGETTSYIPPYAKRWLVKKRYRENHPMDIEDRLDGMNIDG